MSDHSQDISEDDDKVAEIAALEQRVTAAFGRINAALGGLGGGDDAELAELNSALDEERAKNLQLEDRLRQMQERQAGAMQELEDRVIGFGKRSAEQQAELSNLREVCTRLRENNSQLRESNAAGGGDVNLINSGLQAEIDMLRAQMQADRAELDAILAELRPAIQAAQPAVVSEGAE